MNKMILTAVAAGVVGFGMHTAQAGDREWATVGKVLTGVAAGVVIAKAIDCEPAYAHVSYGYAVPSYSVSYSVSTAPPCPPPPPMYAPAPVVMPPPIYYAPPPVIVRQPVVYAPAPVYMVTTYSHPGRGHANGHNKHDGPGRR